MRTLLALVLSLWVFAHYAAATESKILKQSYPCFARKVTDEFTENSYCWAGIYLPKDGLYSTTIMIFPDEKVLSTKGEYLDKAFIQLYHERYSKWGEVVVDGVLIDGEKQPLEGAGWKKNLIAAFKEGKRVTVRATFTGTLGTNTVTVKGSLSGFTACWNAIPKEFIGLEDKEVETDEKKEAPEKPKE